MAKQWNKTGQWLKRWPVQEIMGEQSYEVMRG